MNNLTQKLASLSPKQRALLERKLKAKARKRQPAVKPPPIVHRQVDGPCLLSLDQERLWFIDQLVPGNAAYNINAGTRLRGSLNAALLEKSINEVIKRHESLRTTFIEQDGEPRQIVAAELTIRIEHIDLQHLPADAREAEAERQSGLFAAQPFDLCTGPLIRYLLMQLGLTEHILVSVMHHIITDWWSSQIIVDEIALFYNAFVSNEPPQVADVPFQFTDFALWERAYVESHAMEKSLAYWRKNLSNGTFTLNLPIAKPRTEARRYIGSRQWLDFSPELIQGLRQLSRRMASTLFTVLTAAYKTLLFRYTGQTDITMGGPLADRTQEEWKNVVGFMITMLIYHTELTGDLSFKELLKRERQIIVQSYTHKDVPFGELMKIAGVERDWNRNPLFQHSFIFLNLDQWHNAGVDFESLQTEHIDYDLQASRFDTTLTIWDMGDSFRAYIEYDTDLYHEADMARFAGHFQTLLASIVAQPELPIGQLPMLTEGERQQILVEWNQTQTDYPRDKTIVQLFEEQVARTPDAVVVVFQDQQLSYRELNARANQLAHHLQSLGVGPEVLVGICVERSIEMMVGLLGILKAGGAYLPLDPTYPQERLAFMLEDSATPLLLTQTDLLPQLPATNAQLSCLDSDWPQLALLNSDNPRRAAQAQQLAYVIYTSGSTGQPKGVKIPHRALTNFLWTMKEQPGLNQQDILLSVTTLSFDIAALELYLPLIVGAKVVLVDHEKTVDGEGLAETLINQNVTVMQATPATWRLLIESGWDYRPIKILCGGEAMSSDLKTNLLKRCRELWNVYGPTETTIWSVIHHIHPNDEQILIGRPIANTQVYILDEKLNPTPIGLIGTLYIGGDGMAEGYLNRVELTKERFIDNPYGDGRLYNTGDLARYQQDGTIECLGRIDHQVKIRGFRIELGEIEAVLNNHLTVQEAVVIAREDTLGEKRLVAYVVERQGNQASFDSPLDATTMRDYLRQKLPDYMVPSVFVWLERVPLTPNGKVDRKALPAPTDSIQIGTSREYVAPQTAVEERVAAIWSDILTINKISIHDNFFDLGGHSLLAIRLVAEIDTQFGRRLPLAILFQHPTVAQLARLLSQGDSEVIKDRTGTDSNIWSPVVAIQPNGTRSPLFFVPGAGGHPYYLWQLAQALGNDQPFYGLQPPGAEGDMPPLTHMDEFVDFFLDALEHSEFTPPYLLGGHSSGGHIAFALALALEEKGHTVPMLMLVDMDAPGEVLAHHFDEARIEWQDWETVGALVPHVQSVKYRLGDRLPLSLEHLQTLGGEEAMHYVTDAYKAANLIPAKAGLEQIKRMTAISSATMLAIEQFRPQTKYQGQLQLFHAQESDFVDAAQMAKGWQAFCTQPVSVQSVPGNHLTILNPPHVQQLAKQMRKSLEERNPICY